MKVGKFKKGGKREGEGGREKGEKKGAKGGGKKGRRGGKKKKKEFWSWRDYFPRGHKCGAQERGGGR